MFWVPFAATARAPPEWESRASSGLLPLGNIAHTTLRIAAAIRYVGASL